MFGSADSQESDPDYELALAVGRRLAELGYTIANGGYRGTMEASARGAVEAGGKVIGVTCSLWKSPPNRFITRREPTTRYDQRLFKLIELGRCGYVCLSGSTGTLAELAVVWEMLNKGLLPRRPLVCVGGFWQPMIEFVARICSPAGDLVTVVGGADELAECFPLRT